MRRKSFPYRETLRRFVRVVNRFVRFKNGVSQRVAWSFVRSFQIRLRNDRRRNLTCKFSGRVSAHAVRHDK